LGHEYFETRAIELLGQAVRCHLCRALSNEFDFGWRLSVVVDCAQPMLAYVNMFQFDVLG
jgi:hypothetical protein